MDNLKNKTFSALAWNLAQRMGLRLIQFMPTIILARLLTPAEFGLIGMLTLFIALAATFLDSGFSLALIQKKNASYLDECSMFYFNILVGAVLTLALFLAAPLIAAFYHQPTLTGLTRVLSFGILISAFDIIQTTRLTRALDFKTQFKTTILGSLASGALGIVAAYLGLGVWSLAIQSIADDLISTGTLWIVCDWRPALLLSLNSLKGMFGFGSRMLLTNLVGTFFDNIYGVIIGKVFSANELGYYIRGDSLRTIAINTTSDAFGNILFPALATIQDDSERLKRAYKKSLQMSAFVHFPLMAGLIVVAKPLIFLLLSAKWQETVPLFQLMCCAGLLYPLQIVNLDILKVKGRSDLFLRLTLIKRSLTVIAIFITFPWGINMLLVGQIVLAVIAYFLNSFYSEKLIGYSMIAQVQDVLQSLAFCLLMGGGMWLVGHFLSAGDFITLLVQGMVGLILYFLLNLLARTDPLLEVFALGNRLSASFTRN